MRQFFARLVDDIQVLSLYIANYRDDRLRWWSLMTLLLFLDYLHLLVTRIADRYHLEMRCPRR